MRRPKLSTLSKAFDALLVEKRSLAEKEQGLIAKLNKVLALLGYRVDRAKQPGVAPGPRRRRRDSGGPRVTLQSTNNHMNHGQKRRGRPSLKKVA